MNFEFHHTSNLTLAVCSQ